MAKRSRSRAPAPLTAGLKPEHQVFADEYLANGFNGRRAYLKAFPRVTLETADVCASRLLRSAKVAGYLRTRIQATLEGRQMDGDEALARLACFASADVRRLYQDGKWELLPPSEWPDEVAIAVKAVKPTPFGTAVVLNDQLQALQKVLEQTGKLKGAGDSISALAEAIKADRARSAELLGQRS
jgi:phage terminase small subunit